MGVLIGHAVQDEDGKAIGTLAGDQTGKEVVTRSWYSREGGWGVYLECLDRNLAERAVGLMIAACDNPGIGYSQPNRWGLRNALKAGATIDNAVGDTDCSALIDTLYELAGLSVERGYTGNLESRYLATGKFKAFRDAAHLTSADYAKAGGLYLTAGKHVAMVLEDGALSEDTAPDEPADDGLEPPYVEVVIRGEHGVRVRTSPVSGSKARENARFGEKLPYIDTDPDTGWYRVEVGDHFGWITYKPKYVRLVTVQ